MASSNSIRPENIETPEIDRTASALSSGRPEDQSTGDRAYQLSLAEQALSDQASNTFHPIESDEFNAIAKDILLEKQKWRNIRHSSTKNQLTGWKSLGLKTKVTLAAIALSVLPALGIGSIAFVQARSTVETQIQTAKQNRAIALTRRLQIYTGFRLSEAKDLTTRLIFRDPLVIDRIGKAEITRRLDEYISLHNNYDSLAFFDLDGNVVFQSSGKSLPNIQSESYFQSAITSGEISYTSPQKNREIDEPAVFITAPIKSLDGLKIIGAIRLRLPEDSIFRAVSDIQTQTDDIYVVDRDGNYILTPPTEQDLVGEKLDSQFNELWQKLNKQQTKTLNTQDKNSQNWLISSSGPQVESGLFNPQWTGLIKTPVEDAFRVERQLLLTLVVGTGTTILVSLALALFLANRTTRPLLSAANAVKKMGEGDLEVRLEVPKEGDELVQLGQNINLMGSQLKNFFEQQTTEARLAQILGDLARIRDEDQLPALLDQTMHEIQRQIGGDRVMFQRTDDASGSGTILAEAVLPNLPHALGAVIPALSAADRESYKNQQTIVLTDINQGELAQEQLQQLQAWQVTSMLATPVFINDKLYGILAIHSCGQEKPWTPGDSDFITQIGSRLSLALGGFESFQQAQNRAFEEREAKEKLQQELLGFLNSVEDASTGDLTVRAQITAGEIGIVADFFNAIVENLRDVVTEVKQAADQVSSSVSTSGHSIGNLATETLNQSHQVKETLVSVELMTKALQNVASKAQEATQTTQQAELTAQAGGEAMEKTVDSIQQVRQTVAETAKKVKRLGESSQQISKVVELINQIALKTNLLAVNAGIEAARAGEEGRGFAVVAEEVGALAAQSATATKEIEQIINSIQTGTSEVVEAMESSTTQVVEGTRSVEQAQNSLAKILAASQQVNEVFQMISQETVEQADISSLVQQLMGQMASVSETASQDSEKVSQLLAETVQVAEQLQTTMSSFKVERT